MEIFPHVSSGGGVDWSSKTSQLAKAESNSTTLTTVVDITGSGYVTSINAVAPGNDGFVQITIDGVVKISDLTRSIRTGNATFVGPLRFNQSLKVEHKSVNSSYYIHTQVSYVLD